MPERVSPVVVVASQGNWSEVIQPSTAHSKINKDISCLADEAICLVNPTFSCLPRPVDLISSHKH